MQARISSKAKLRRMVTIALLMAVVIVLQIICTFIKFGPFSITLALTPIVIGAAIFGWKTGAFLGFIFSIVVYFTGLMGWDGGFVLALTAESAIGTMLLCLVKGTAAGAVAGLLYQPLTRKSPKYASLAVSIAAPLTNTGLFAVGILTVFYGFLSNTASAAGENPIGLLFLGWIGLNFIVEFVVNVMCSSVITQLVNIYRKEYKA